MQICQLSNWLPHTQVLAHLSWATGYVHCSNTLSVVCFNMRVYRGAPHGGTQLTKKGDINAGDVAAIGVVDVVGDTDATGDEGDVTVGDVGVGASRGADV